MRTKRAQTDARNPAQRRETPPVATLGELHANPPRWFWLTCGNPDCTHKTPAALAPFIIRWGADTSSDRLRAAIVCKKCGHKGGRLFHPSWADSTVGWQPFPIERMDS
jgi:hypothetical protein